MRFLILALCMSVIALSGCEAFWKQGNSEDTSFQSSSIIPHEKYILPNGLTVILHEDHSDPIVHVDVTYHVGSSREQLGMSGFAHFFEHMMFQGSQHVADEEHFKIVTQVGGTMNGATNKDRTNYYQTVPSNQLEKILWLESDRMGFLLPAVTSEKFEIQRETVKNERAQTVDNRPYERRFERISEAFYPHGHPYSWSTIGYVEDLDRVTVEDLKAFFTRWYGPNNAILTIGGDIDVAQTKKWIEKYFAGIPRGPEVLDPSPQPVTLSSNRYVTLEDNVHLPLLQIAYPTVYLRHQDEAALDVLANVLGGGNTSLLHQQLVNKGIALQTGVSHPCREIACEFQVTLLANPQHSTDLKIVKQAYEQALIEFERNGITHDDLELIRAGIEASTVFGLQSVAGKVSTLAYNQVFEGNPDPVRANIDRFYELTPDDVMRVYRQYIKNKAGVLLSVIPHGQTELAVAPQNVEPSVRDYQLTTTTLKQDTNQALNQRPIKQESFDRRIQPPAGAAPVINVPPYWRTTIAKGLPVIGVTSKETPTVGFTIFLDGGPLLDSKEQAGLAVLTANLMNESTLGYSTQDMANILGRLGSQITITTGVRDIAISVSSLSKNIEDTLAILEEKMFRPKFDEAEFNRVKSAMMQGVQQSANNPNVIAGRAESIILYGENQRLSLPDGGTLRTLSKITLDDVKQFYQNYFSPKKARMVIVGDITEQQVPPLFSFLNHWSGDDYEIPPYIDFPRYDQQHIYFVDSPGAMQSIVTFIKRSLPFDATGKQFRSRLMNFPLGGTFNSRVNLNLREDKAYTYGAGTSFNGGKTLGSFVAGADVLVTSTGAAVRELMDEIKRFAQSGITQEELEFMRSSFTLGEALQYESPSSKGRFLSQLMQFNLPDSYRDEQMEIIKTITKQEIDLLAKELLSVDDMQIIVVGDKNAVMPQLKSLDIPIIEMSLNF